MCFDTVTMPDSSSWAKLGNSNSGEAMKTQDCQTTCCACTGHWLHWSSEHLSPCQGWCKHAISTWQSLWCKCCYEVMGWDLGINHPAQQKAEDWEGIHVLQLCEPRSSPCTLSHLCTGQLDFPLLGAEGNVFGGLGNDYWPSHLGDFPS